MKPTDIDLTEPLPYPSRFRWGYQHYPVYSGAWWRGRALVFGLGVLLITLLSGFGMAIDFDNKGAALETTFVTLVGWTGMAYTGATLCTLARLFIRKVEAQKIGVTIGLIVGFVATVFFDAWSSAYIGEAFMQYSSQSGAIKAAADAEAKSNAAQIVNATFGAGLYFWLASGIAFIRYWREPGQLRTYLAEKELSEVKASRTEVQSRLSMLQAQIEPHFLFNSLASIKATVRNSPELAETSIDDLVEYLRASIPRLDEQQQAKPTTLRRQIELCDKYLKVMQLRMGDRLRFHTQIDPKIAEHSFPPLLIISLVENAVKHGLEPKVDGGDIQIIVTSTQGKLKIEVRDSGLGLRQSSPAELSSGFGLANIREQLKLLFGERGKLSLESNQLGGTTATVEIADFV